MNSKLHKQAIQYLEYLLDNHAENEIDIWLWEDEVNEKLFDYLLDEGLLEISTEKKIKGRLLMLTRITGYGWDEIAPYMM